MVYHYETNFFFKKNYYVSINVAVNFIINTLNYNLTSIIRIGKEKKNTMKENPKVNYWITIGETCKSNH